MLFDSRKGRDVANLVVGLVTAWSVQACPDEKFLLTILEKSEERMPLSPGRKAQLAVLPNRDSVQAGHLVGISHIPGDNAATVVFFQSRDKQLRFLPAIDTSITYGKDHLALYDLPPLIPPKWETPLTLPYTPDTHAFAISHLQLWRQLAQEGKGIFLDPNISTQSFIDYFNGKGNMPSIHASQKRYQSIVHTLNYSDNGQVRTRKKIPNAIRMTKSVLLLKANDLWHQIRGTDDNQDQLAIQHHMQAGGHALIFWPTPQNNDLPHQITHMALAIGGWYDEHILVVGHQEGFFVMPWDTLVATSASFVLVTGEPPLGPNKIDIDLAKRSRTVKWIDFKKKYE